MERYGRTFKELSFKEKVEQFKEYYLWPMVGTIIGIVVVVHLVVTMLTPQRVYTVDMQLVGRLKIDEETLNDVTQHFDEAYDASLIMTYLNWADPGEVGQIVMQKLPLQITAREVDILGLPEAAADSYLKETQDDAILALDTVPEFAELIEEYKDQVYINGYEEVDTFEVVKGDQHVYGFKVNQIDNIPCVTLGEEFILSVTTTVKNIDETVEMMRYLLEEQTSE